MDKEKVIHTFIHILKKIAKWSLIVLAAVCTILIFIVVYLLVSEFFYNGET